MRASALLVIMRSLMKPGSVNNPLAWKETKKRRRPGDL
jgi:hypothetical protein